MSEPCCIEFEKYATEYSGQNVRMYPGPLPDAQFERQLDGTWAIYGCCSSIFGCYVVTGMTYCPFCGEKL